MNPEFLKQLKLYKFLPENYIQNDLILPENLVFKLKKYKFLSGDYPKLVKPEEDKNIYPAVA